MESALSIIIDRSRKKTLTLVLAAGVSLIIFTMAHSHPNIWTDFDKEKNAWTFGNSLMMFLVSIVAYVNYLITSSRGSDRSKGAWVWMLLALAYLFFASDDWLMLHERAGHAVERSVHALNRSEIVVYMDDLLELAYVLAGGIIGVLFYRKIARGNKAMQLYILSLGFMLLATLLGLPPAMKSRPFPLAVIQILQLASVYAMLYSFINCTAYEISYRPQTIEDQLPDLTEVAGEHEHAPL